MATEESIFIGMMGDYPLTKVLEFLLTAREFDYSKKEIAEGAQISYNTLSSIWPLLLSNGTIAKTRRIGKQDMFRLNSENAYVKTLITFFDSLLSKSIEEKSRKTVRQLA